jgi:hypothetical protein
MLRQATFDLFFLPVKIWELLITRSFLDYDNRVQIIFHSFILMCSI